MKRIYYLLTLTVMGLSSCVKEEIDPPTFEVSTAATSYKVGEAVKFDIKGNADIVTFWSGEDGFNYDNKERTVLTGGKIEMSFTSRVEFGRQERNLQVYLSNDFSGGYNPTEIEKAKWIDITDRFTYATSTTVFPSGVKDISDLLQPSKPFYIGFKYDGQPVVGNNTQRTWTVNALSITNTFPGNKVVQLLNQATAGYLFIDILNPTNFWNFNGSALIFRPSSATTESLDWAITAPVIADRTNPDVGLGIKSFADNTLTSYEYVYNSPGTYKVVFVVSNATVKGQEKSVKELTITINP